jgi:hypothetical protein
LAGILAASHLPSTGPFPSPFPGRRRFTKDASLGAPCKHYREQEEEDREAFMAKSKPGNTRLRCLRIGLKRTQEEIVGDLRACADRMRTSGKLSKRVDFSVR